MKNNLCVNGDKRPIQPPSKVLCKEYLAELDRKFTELAKRYGCHL